MQLLACVDCPRKSFGLSLFSYCSNVVEDFKSSKSIVEVEFS